MYCPQCGSQMADASNTCTSCGWQQVAASASFENDPAMRVLLPVGRSMWAILAGYLGLMSLIFFPAPFALIAGILALQDIKRHPEKGALSTERTCLLSKVRAV